MAEVRSDALPGGVTPAGTAAPHDAPVRNDAPSSEERDFQKFYDAMPQWARDEYNQRVWNFTNAQLNEQFGDVLPAFLEIANDPEARKTFARMKDKDLRTFLFQNGVEVFDRTHTAPGGERTATDGGETFSRKDVEQMFKERDDKATQAQTEQQYIQNRVADKDALLREHPDFAWKDQSDPNYRYVANLIETAHALSVSRGRFVSCKEVLDEQRRGEAPPPAAPSVSRSEVGVERPQAPTTPTEGTANMVKKLAKMGGITRGARALQRR